MKTILRSHIFLCFFYILTTILQLVIVESVLAENSRQLINQEILTKAKKKYGVDGYYRLVKLQDLIHNDTSTNDMEKLKKVNLFFNQLQFVSDSLHYQKEDYWATPIEFLASGGGDCEDFSLAKYFTLRAMGVAEKKLNLTYVKAVELNQAHMVMTYFKTPGADPLVLDNLINIIKPASQRVDLLPVYSFNGTGLWLAKQRGRGKYVGRSDRLKRWQELQKRMPKGFNG